MKLRYRQLPLSHCFHQAWVVKSLPRRSVCVCVCVSVCLCVYSVALTAAEFP